MTNSSSVSASTESESKLERALRDSIKVAANASEKRRFERELASARSTRERENARVNAEVAQANQVREANLRAKRAEAGSRFNVRYKQGIPEATLTPEGLMAALAPYAELVGAPASNSATRAGASAKGGQGVLGLRKGLSISEVEALLGPANTASESREGSLTVMKRNYVVDGKRISTSFVNDVLIDYSIAPQ